MTSSAIAGTGLKAHWSGVLGQPWVDRTIAIIASVPFVWLAHYRYQNPQTRIATGFIRHREFGLNRDHDPS